MHTPLTPAARHALRAFAENLNRNVTLPAPSAAVAELHDAGILRQPRGSLAAHELTPLGAVVLFRLLAERANLSPSAMVALVDDAGRLLSPASDASRPRPAGMLGLRDMMHRDILRAFEPLYAKIERAGVPSHVALPTLVYIVGRYLQAEGYPLWEALDFVADITRKAYALPGHSPQATEGK